MAKIMLVDDAAFMRMMIKKALSASGYNDFIEAQDGAEAVKKYSEENPDMVIMDITMPNMDGLQALKKIREGDPNAKVVMCTAMGQERDVYKRQGNNFGGDPLQLTNVKINSLGEISGTVKSTEKDKDGKTVSIGKVAIATFQNPEGLSKKGSFYYGAAESDNSGNASATIPGGSTSSLMTGYLEASNVDLAKEFSDMITTQRGFQANSKIITVSDEILSDLINMKR